MYIPPSNQTLILAGERPHSRKPQSAPSKSASARTTVLQRVMIVASQPDSTVVYLRADYESHADRRESTPIIDGGAASGSATRFTAHVPLEPSIPESERSSSNALSIAPSLSATVRDDHGNVLLNPRDTTITSYLRPVEQYARTQRMSDLDPIQQIDVLA